MSQNQPQNNLTPHNPYNLFVQVTDVSAIEPIVREVIAANEKQFAEFKSGNNPKMKGFFVGQVMKKSGGKANPGLVNQILDKLAAE